MRWEYPASLVIGLATMLAVTTVAAASGDSEHTRFEQQLRDNIITSLAKSRFSSDCFMAENGLHAQVAGHFDENRDLVLETQYFLDRSCSAKAGMQSLHRGQLEATGHDPNRFSLAGHVDIVIDRRHAAIFFGRGTEIVSLAERGIQQ